MITKGVIEVILYVKDMDAQVRFYRDSLGLQVSYPPAAHDFSQENWVTFDTGACTLALHSGGQGRLGADAPKIVLGVDDIHQAREQLIQRGVAVGEVRLAAPGTWVCDGADPEANKFSIESHE